MVFTQYACSIILHMSFVEDTFDGLELCKYALNHHYRFKQWYMAFVAGLMKTTVNILNEFLLIMVIIGTHNVMDLLLNFIALSIIAGFAELIYESQDDSMKDIIENEDCKVFVKEHTTSTNCKPHEKSKVIDEKGELRPLRVIFSQRSIFNMFCYILYKFFRLLYVSVYYYFTPAITVLLIWVLPLSVSPEWLVA